MEMENDKTVWRVLSWRLLRLWRKQRDRSGAIGEGRAYGGSTVGLAGGQEMCMGLLRTVGPGIPGRKAMVARASALGVGNPSENSMCGLSPQHPDLLLWVTARLCREDRGCASPLGLGGTSQAAPG